MPRAPMRGARLPATLLLVVSGVALLAHPAAAEVAARHATCEASAIRVSFGATGIDTSHVDAFLDFTNTSPRSCVLDGYPTVHYVTEDGQRIGNPALRVAMPHGDVTLGPQASAEARFRSTVPEVFSPSACRRASAFGLSVLPPGTARPRTLRFPSTVCAGSTVRASTIGAVRLGRGPVPGPCTAPSDELRTSLGRPHRGAQRTYLPILFTDPVLYTCAIEGFPRVQSVRGAVHRAVGPPASPVGAPARSVWVQPFGGTASAELTIIDTATLPTGSCRPERTSGLLVTAPGATVAALRHYPHTVCTAMASTSITSVGAGRRR